MAKEGIQDPGGRYAVETVRFSTSSGSLGEALAEALNRGDAKGWEPLQVFESASAGVHIVWDKAPGGTDLEARIQ